MIAGGISGNDILISRYNANGTLDQAFNGSGTAMINYGSQTPPFLSAIRLQGNGKIVVGAEAIINGLGKIILSRLTTSGSIDPQFAAQGFLHTDFFQALSRNSFAILPDNKILICGRTYAPANYSVARYTADGSPDATFGSGGPRRLTMVSMKKLLR